MKRNKQNYTDDKIQFQAMSWNDCDTVYQDKVYYTIFINGVTENGLSVCLKVLGFNPYFYVLINEEDRKHFSIDQFRGEIASKMYKQKEDLTSVTEEKLMKLYPYLAKKKFKFIKISFSTNRSFYTLRKLLSEGNLIIGNKNVKLELYDFNIPHINRFCHITGIQNSGWIEANNIEHYDDNSQINICVDFRNVHPIKIDKISPLILLSWDIECLAENTEEFPDPNKPKDEIKQISAVVSSYGLNNTTKFLFTIGECSEIKDVKVKSYSTEKELLKGFYKFFYTTDPDFICGYNTWGFDDNYLWKRMEFHSLETAKFSRNQNIEAKLEVKTLNSNAYGNNSFTYINMPGRESFDLLVHLRREYKFERYNLDSMAEYFLKEHKKDLPYSELFKKLNGNPDDIALCGDYCVQDSNLVLRMLIKLNILPNFIAMSNTCYVPFNWLLFRGQQCKAYSLIVKEAREKGYAVYSNKNQEANKFKGATVLTAKDGYYNEPVAGLDFASLYPSIMIAHNLCYTTMIIDSETLEFVKSNNIKYEEIKWKEDDKTYSFRFVQLQDPNSKFADHGDALLPKILTLLGVERKSIRKMMETEKDNFTLAILDGMQLARKLIMNSIYGFVAAEGRGILPLQPIAMCVTAKGREMIAKTSELAESKFNVHTVYGDSIPGYEKITIIRNVKNQNETCETYEKIEDYADSLLNVPWEEYRGFKIGNKEIKNKYYKNTEELNIYTKTHMGIGKINKIIKHDCNKKLVKITAVDNNGIVHSVIVTKDHGVIDNNGKSIPACELKIGQKLWE